MYNSNVCNLSTFESEKRWFCGWKLDFPSNDVFDSRNLMLTKISTFKVERKVNWTKYFCWLKKFWKSINPLKKWRMFFFCSSFFQSVCVLGYCVLPLTLALITCKILLAISDVSTTIFAIRCVVVVASLVWSCFGKIFCSSLYLQIIM